MSDLELEADLDGMRRDETRLSLVREREFLKLELNSVRPAIPSRRRERELDSKSVFSRTE